MGGRSSRAQEHGRRADQWKESGLCGKRNRCAFVMKALVLVMAESPGSAVLCAAAVMSETYGSRHCEPRATAVFSAWLLMGHQRGFGLAPETGKHTEENRG